LLKNKRIRRIRIWIRILNTADIFIPDKLYVFRPFKPTFFKKSAAVIPEACDVTGNAVVPEPVANVTVASGGGGDVGQRGRGGRGGVRVRGGTGRGRERGRGGVGAIKVSTPGSYSMVVSKVFLFIFMLEKQLIFPRCQQKIDFLKSSFGLLLFDCTVVHIHHFQRY
jgi:hypothetical protein